MVNSLNGLLSLAEIEMMRLDMDENEKNGLNRSPQDAHIGVGMTRLWVALPRTLQSFTRRNARKKSVKVRANNESDDEMRTRKLKCILCNTNCNCKPGTVSYRLEYAHSMQLDGLSGVNQMHHLILEPYPYPQIRPRKLLRICPTVQCPLKKCQRSITCGVDSPVTNGSRILCYELQRRQLTIDPTKRYKVTLKC